MTGRDFKGAVISGVALALCFIAVVRQPVIDAERAEPAPITQAEAEAAMNAKLHAKFDRLLADGERMTFPVSAYPKDRK
jgi:hypothetical protein